MLMDIRAMHNEADYAWALREIEAYFDKVPAPGTKAANRFDILAALIKDYEDRHYAIPDADPIDVLHFAIESMGKTQAELGRIIGSKPHASEILNRKRRLTLEMIRRISDAWKLPVQTLTAAYRLQKEYA
jgi:HTH-type transcriptional regulator / antitoxin HigA